MDRALVVVEPGEGKTDLVARAAALARGVDAELFLLTVMPESKFQDRQAAFDSVEGFKTGYGVDNAAGAAQQFAEEVGLDAVDDGQSFSAIGRIGDRETEVLAAAREHDVDHVFVHGRERSPAGKAVFGDLAQAIVLGFDGPVTVTTGGSE